MKKNIVNEDIDLHDRITEAYYGKLGKKLMRETQHRIHWICQNVNGNKILDIGCSQGIVPLLLGREGKSVLGLDISQKAIDEANLSLSAEEIDVQKNVEFLRSNFMLHNFKDEKFDTIIIAEVLEHLVNPNEFIDKAESLLKGDGSLIITIPFGINDFIDHKKTYYYHDMCQMLSPNFEIRDLLILGKWIGFIANIQNNKKSYTANTISIEMLKTIEKAFYSTERELVDLNIDNQKEIADLNTRLNDTNERYKQRVSLSNNRETEYLGQINQLKGRLDNANDKYKQRAFSANEKETKYLEQINQLKNKLNNTSEKIIELEKRLENSDEIEQELKRTKQYLHESHTSASYRLGHLFIHELKSFRDVVALPKKILNIKKKNTLPNNKNEKIKEETPLPIVGWEENIDKNKLTIMGIFDEFTHTCYQYQYNLIEPRPDNFRELLDKYKPKFLFVESTWKGNYGSWQYRVAKYSNPPGDELKELVLECKRRNIPTIFWNKEDPVHFDNFKDASKHFDFIFTSAQEAINNYKEISDARVEVLQFAAEEHIHNPMNSTSRKDGVCFAGSYYANRFVERRDDQLMLLRSAKDFNLEIFDRNYSEDSSIKSDFAFPQEFDKYVIGSLPYEKLLKHYTSYKVFLNVNSIIDSKTMFSRRIFELLACGTPVVSTQALGIDETFGKDIVWIVKNEEEAKEALTRLMNDSKEWRRRSLKGIRSVFNNHTYKNRSSQIYETIFGSTKQNIEKFLAVSFISTQEELSRVVEIFNTQKVSNIEMLFYIVTNNKELINSELSGSYKIIYNDSKVNKSNVLEKIIEDEKPYYFSLFSSSLIYGKYFINDAIIALKYSSALFYAKPKSMQDTYAYSDNIFKDSLVCNYVNLRSREKSLKSAVEFLVDKNNDFNRDVYCADAANFYNSSTMVPLDSYNKIINDIEI